MAAKYMSQINLMEQNHLCMFFCMGSDTLPPATHMNNSYLYNSYLYGKEELGKYIVVFRNNNRKYKTDVTGTTYKPLKKVIISLSAAR